MMNQKISLRLIFAKLASLVVLVTLTLLATGAARLMDPYTGRPPMAVGKVVSFGKAMSSNEIDEENLPDMKSADQAEIQLVLDRQVAAWNKGDIELFMAGYWKSPKLTFASGGHLTRGWQETHDRYVARYSPPDQMGHLWFDHLEFQSLAEDVAMVLGQWHLKNQTGEVAEGNFSLIVKRFGSGWKIVHDHTSLAEPETSKPAAEPEK